MAFRDGPLENLKVPLIWTAGLTVLAVLAVSVFLLLSQRRDDPDSQNAIRGAGDQVSGGVGGVLAAPVRWVGAASDYIGDYFFAVSENRRLKEQVAELQAVADANIALQNINSRYESMLGIRVEPPVPTQTARSISESRGPFARSRLIDDGNLSIHAWRLGLYAQSTTRVGKRFTKAGSLGATSSGGRLPYRLFWQVACYTEQATGGLWMAGI